MRIRTETVVGLFIIAAIGAFFYMTFQIGIFRLDAMRYHSYTAYFKDVVGLTKKAEVKIAGVKVGWVESVELRNDAMPVKITFTLLKGYHVYTDGQAVIRQEGLVGPKFLEILPGQPAYGLLRPGQALTRLSQESASLDELLHTFRRIATNVEDVSTTLKESFGGAENSNRLKETLHSFGQAAERIALVSQTLHTVVTDNQHMLHGMMSDMQSIVKDLKERIPVMSDAITQITHRLQSDFLPTVTADFHNIVSYLTEQTLPKLNEDISCVVRRLDTDFLPRVAQALDRASLNFESTTGSLNNLTADISQEFKRVSGDVAQAAHQAQQSIEAISKVAEKINTGQGLLGKLINEDETYNDLRSAVKSVSTTLAKLERIRVVIDAHAESMQGLAEERFSFPDTKGYANVRIYPNEDYFYLAGLAFSQKGFIDRRTFGYRYFDEKNNEILPTQLRQEAQLCDLVARKEVTEIIRDSYRLNLQVGKRFGDVILRAGLFEGTFGVAAEYDIPLNNDAYKWITILEAFDFKGRNRLFNDTRPHLKWLNKVFICSNLYLAFGADDFISRHNKNAFFGAGVRFADDDLKYLISLAH